MIEVRPWVLTEGERQALLRELRFRHFKWDAYACGTCLVLPETMIVSAALHQDVVRAAEGIHRALTRFDERVRRDAGLLERLGVPRPLHRLIASEVDHGLQCARYDLFPTEDGRLMVSEFNEDVPGGFNEAVGLPELLGDPGPGLRWEAGLRRAIVDAFEPYGRVAFLYATAFSEDLQHMLILERWLGEAGHRTVLGSPAHVRRGWRRVRVLGEPVDAAFRYYPGEWMPRLPNFGEWLGVGERLPMMNPLRRMARQSKLMFALWLEDPGLDAEDRCVIARHCPRTELFRPDLATRLREERERWVLKRAFGRMGDAVVMGCLTDEKAWDAAIAEASRSPSEWCIQERFTVRPLEFRAGSLYPTLGAFVVNGRFAGYYSRAAPRPFLTHEAYHVATVVRTA